MGNSFKGEVSFDVDGKSYRLRYSTDALVQLEEKLDRGIVDISGEMMTWGKTPSKMRLGLIRALLWAGLQDHHPDIDIKAAGELITKAGGLAAIANLVGEGMALAFPAPEMKDARPPKQQAQPGTG